jgi:2-amino-4-hydroxy-6-hydroxymethyldihydropteridine diphosphokinase
VRRAYMLGPAAEIAPDTVHPTLHVTLAELWRNFEQGGHPLEPVSLDWRAEARAP